MSTPHRASSEHVGSPSVSVIVPTYDRLALLRETIASVLAQTHRDLELIVVDDGSTDGTAEYVRSIADPRVRLVEQPHSGNIARTRNLGVAAARAPWLAFLDSDDVWHPDKLARQIAETTAAGARWSYTRYRLTDSLGTPAPWRSGGSVARSGWLVRPLITNEIGVTICSVMTERELFHEAGGFREQFPSRQDFDLVVRIALRAPAHAVDECLLDVRDHPARATTMASLERLSLQAALVYGALAPLLDDRELRRIARRTQSIYLSEAAARLMRRGAMRDAAACFARAVAAGVGARQLASTLARGAGLKRMPD